MKGIDKLIDICIECNNPIYKDDRHMRILQGQEYNGIIADEGDIIIYQCPNCKEKIYTC